MIDIKNHILEQASAARKDESPLSIEQIAELAEQIQQKNLAWSKEYADSARHKGELIHDQLIDMSKRYDQLNFQFRELYDLLNEHLIEWEKDSGDWDEFEWHDRVSKALANQEIEMPRHPADITRIEGLRQENQRLNELIVNLHSHAANGEPVSKLVEIIESMAWILKDDAFQVIFPEACTKHRMMYR